MPLTSNPMTSHPGPTAPPPSNPPRTERPAGARAWLDGLAQDAKFAVRSLRKAPGFLAVAVVTLALGIGANTAIFSVVRGVLLEPLPYPDPGHLVQVWELNQRGSTMNAAGQNFRDWRDQAKSFQSLAAYAGGETALLGGTEPVRTGVAAVSRGFFDTLGVVPELGRAPRPDEHVQGAEPVAVVSHRFWRDQLGGRPLEDGTSGTSTGPVGSNASLPRLEADEFSFRVVGVMPPAFDFPAGTDLWFPKELYPANPYRSGHNWHVIGRLAPGVSIAQADTELDGITARLVSGSDEAPDYLASGAQVTGLHDELVGSVRKPLWILLGAAGLVLLVACSNLASAFLARGTDRHHEMAVRGSLGADRGRLLRQLFVESLAVALAGAAAGVALAVAAVRALVLFGPSSLPRLDAARLDPQVLAFTLVLAVVTAVLFGLVPALRLTRSAAEGLSTGSHASRNRSWQRSWRLLVTAEVALALVLLVGSGLLIQSLWRILRVDLGFEARSVVTVNLDLPLSHYQEGAAIGRFHRALIDAVAGAPGVEAAGVLSSLPLSGHGANGRLGVRGAGGPYANAEYRLATGGAFRALQVPLLQGRLFDRSDRPDTVHVVVVNRAFAESVWPGESPLGKQIDSGGMESRWGPGDWATVVGVVGNIRDLGLDRPIQPTVYFNALQRPDRTASATLVVRSTAGPEATAAAARAAVRRIDPNVPTEVASMERVIRRSVSQRRFSVALLGGFAGLALILSLVGIYGVVAYTVGRRRRELGIRLALGATPARVRNLVLRESMAPVVLGLVLGAAGALAATRVLQSLLFEVRPSDPATFAAVAVTLGAAALAASYVPARTSARIDPVETIREE